MFGCSRTARHRVLTFFFDEVPSMDSAKYSVRADSLAIPALTAEIHSDSLLVANSTWFFHPLLNKKECMSCHDITASFRLFQEPENLCVNCHNQAKAAVVHAPVEEGACGECHAPHGSKNAHMLIETGAELCFQCHDDEEVKPVAASSLHTPVASGDCIECHNPHGSENPQMLLAVADELCFKCHNKEKIKTSETHTDIGETKCDECHNPHTGIIRVF